MNFTLNTCDAEYRKDPKIRKEDVQQLLNWIDKQAHMPKVSEYILIQMLSVSDYSIQRAKDLTELFYEYRNNAPELFYENLERVPCSCDFWNLTYGFVLPKITAKGYRILYFGLRNFDTTNYNFNFNVRMYLRMLMTVVFEQGTCPGYIIIYDTKGFGFGHAASMNMITLKKYITFSQEAAPIRMRSAYVVNSHPLVEKVEKMLRPFLNKETADMVSTHSNMEAVFRDLGEECIPTDLGGSLPQTREELNEIMKAKVNAFSEKVTEEWNLKVDESKRLVKKRDEILHMDGGSFRKLEVD